MDFKNLYNEITKINPQYDQICEETYEKILELQKQYREKIYYLIKAANEQGKTFIEINENLLNKSGILDELLNSGFAIYSWGGYKLGLFLFK